MEFRNLGHSGLKVSVAGLGCNNFGMRCDAEQSNAVVHRALDEGINFFDTADIYGNRGKSEEMLAKALGNRRPEVVVATKFGMAMGDGPQLRGASRRYVMAAAEASLKRLGTDYIDLYQLHMPDPDTPQEETLAALDDLVKSGKVRYLGNSNFTSWQVTDAHWISRSNHFAPYVSAQNQYNLLDRRIERELVPACAKFGLGILPYFPLASGFLTGKYRPGGAPVESVRARAAGGYLAKGGAAALEALDQVAAARQTTVAAVALAWLRTRPHVAAPIASARTVRQLAEILPAAKLDLTPAEADLLAAATRPD